MYSEKRDEPFSSRFRQEIHFIREKPGRVRLVSDQGSDD
jgi:hypothetical protein